MAPSERANAGVASMPCTTQKITSRPRGVELGSSFDPFTGKCTLALWIAFGYGP